MAARTEDLSYAALASSKGIRIAWKWRKPSFSPCRKAQSDQHSAVTVVRRQRWRSDIGPQQPLPAQQNGARTAGWLLLVLPDPGAGCCSLQLRFGRQGGPRKMEWHFRSALDLELCAPSLRRPIPVRVTTPMVPIQRFGRKPRWLIPACACSPRPWQSARFHSLHRLSRDTRRLACAGPHVQPESHSLRRKMHLPGSSSENRPCYLLSCGLPPSASLPVPANEAAVRATQCRKRQPRGKHSILAGQFARLQR